MDEFLNDWLSHPEYWFDSKKSYDTYITQKYEHLLHCMWDRTKTNLRYHLAFIIVYDQIARHVYREEEQMIENYLNCALIVRNFINDNFEVANLSAIEWVFYCLPIRHSNVYDKKMLHDTWARVENEKSESEKAVYIRFLKATYERLPIDYIPLEESSSSKKFDFIDYTDIMGYCQFIKEPTYAYENSPIYIAIEDFIVANKIKKLIISLSGGVDSMVCAFILKKLQHLWKFEMTAVHINYCNRSIKEYQFVHDWCSQMQIPLKTRHIEEIKRDACMAHGLRDTYESYTKKVRFQAYLDAWDTYDYPRVFMGHNYDDCFENILTNISRKDRYENLKGMAPRTIVNGIIFMRPMLSIHKKDIYMFAHNASIPYLHDSTPSWSKRGNIRDTVRPVLEKWNPEIIPAFFDLSNRISEYEEITQQYVDSILNNQASTPTTDQIKLSFKSYMTNKTVWSCIFDKLNIGLSQKSLQNFISQLERDQQVVILNKTIQAKIQNTFSGMTVILSKHT